MFVANGIMGNAASDEEWVILFAEICSKEYNLRKQH